MEIKKNVKGLKPIYGIVVAILGIALLIFVAAPIQYKFGMAGLAITEIMILLLAIIPTWILKADFKEVFPIRKPKMREIFGTLLMWVGVYLAIMLLTLIVGYFFPQGLGEVSSALNEVITSVPAGISFVIVAVMPAICEEALMRGFILSSFRSFKNKWYIVVLVGVIFGIFHLDLFRFLPTAILGMALAYIILETDNILLPILFHFINNGVASIGSFVAKSSGVVIPEFQGVPLISIGSYFIIGSMVPFTLLLSAKLLHKKKFSSEDETEKEKKKSARKVYIAAGITVSMIAIGIIIVQSCIKNGLPVDLLKA